jgi:chitinase
MFILETRNSCAIAPGDYASTSGALTFLPGVTTQTITVPIVGDQTAESNELVTINLTNATNAVIGDTQGLGTIYDDDSNRQLVIADGSVVEGDSGTRNLVFTVTLSQASPQAVTVQYATLGASAESPSDYTAAVSGVLTFAPGATVQTITIPVIGDAAAEADEQLLVNLSSAINAEIGDSQAIGTIYDDDQARDLVITDSTVVEGDSGARNLVFTVVMSQPSPVPVTVQYLTSNGTAASPDDYTATGGTLTFAPGNTVQTITVAVLGDSQVEGDETMVVTLTNPSNATLLDGVAIGTIYNDDQRQLVIDDANVMEGDGGTKNLVFRVTLSQAATAPVTVQFQSSNSSAVAPGDYTARSGILTFAPGVTSLSITVPIVGDQLAESAESFFITLSNPVNATLADSLGAGSIFDDDHRA